MQSRAAAMDPTRHPTFRLMGLVSTFAVVLSLGLSACANSSGTTAHNDPPKLSLSLQNPPLAGAAGPVTVTWGDSTGLVRWQAVSGAHGYRITLIRVHDRAITERIQVPANQLAADVQGIWPGVQYVVAVQEESASGTFGPAMLSAPGQAVPISRATYNGFLDSENVAQGGVDPNLWDVVIGDGGQGGAFVNNQMHYHLEAGDGSQTITTMRARVPIDWTNRTVTIHGEVDLKGDGTQWFGVSLTPQAASTDRIIDLFDRFYSPRHMPELELFDDGNGLHLFYAQGNGDTPIEIGHPYPNPLGYNNVRDNILWKVNTTHVLVQVDGRLAFDTNLPSPLAFTHGYLSLLAESYPGAGGGGDFKPACDAPMHDCNVWHLDNWGFDSALGVQPASAAYYAQGCGPYPSREQQVVSFDPCGAIDMGGPDDRTVHDVRVSVTGSTSLVSSAVVFLAKGLFQSGDLQVSVNGGSWQSPAYGGVDLSPYAYQEYLIPINPALLHAGINTITLRRGSSIDSDFGVANVQLETVSRTPFSLPPLPPQPVPLGMWAG